MARRCWNGAHILGLMASLWHTKCIHQPYCLKKRQPQKFFPNECLLWWRMDFEAALIDVDSGFDSKVLFLLFQCYSARPSVTKNVWPWWVITFTQRLWGDNKSQIENRAPLYCSYYSCHLFCQKDIATAGATVVLCQMAVIFLLS